jgi:hypothetical protein
METLSLDEDIKNIFRERELVDLIPIIEEMVFKSDRQRLKVINRLKEKFQEDAKTNKDLRFYNPDTLIPAIADKVILRCGSNWDEFVLKFGPTLKKQYFNKVKEDTFENFRDFMEWLEENTYSHPLDSRALNDLISSFDIFESDTRWSISLNKFLEKMYVYETIGLQEFKQCLWYTDDVEDCYAYYKIFYNFIHS